MMDWDNLRIFLMLARLQSLSAAGARLRIDAATVGRRIQRLEATVGQPLFLRSQQGYRLTEAGERLVAHAETMESSARHAFETVSDTGAQLTGKIRIGAPDGCATYLLPQIIGHLVAENPALEVQVVSLPRIFDLSRREADIAISVSRPDAGARLTVRKVADYGLSLAAHRDYLSAHPPIRNAAEIAGHRLIGYIPDLIVDPQQDYLAQVTKTAPVLSSNSVPVQLAWLRQGLGLGIVHDFVLPHFPELVRVLPTFALTRSFWLVRHADDQSPRMSRFADALAAGLRQSLT